jgi:hypothetical protein
MASYRPYGKFCDFYSVSPVYFGIHSCTWTFAWSEINLTHYLSSLNSVIIPLPVSGLLVFGVSYPQLAASQQLQLHATHTKNR